MSRNGFARAGPANIGTPARETLALLGGVGTPVTGCEGGGPGADTHPFRNEPLVMVAAGYAHVAVVTDRGGVWVWGFDLEHQLGPVPRGQHGRRHNEIPMRWPSSVCGGSPVVMVGCGDQHTLALTRAGHVWTCFFGGSAVVSVKAGQVHSAAVTAAGELWTWGHGFLGPMGLGRMPFTQSAFRAPKRVGAPDAPGKRCVSTLVGVLCLCARRREGENET